MGRLESFLADRAPRLLTWLFRYFPPNDTLAQPAQPEEIDDPDFYWPPPRHRRQADPQISYVAQQLHRLSGEWAKRTGTPSPDGKVCKADYQSANGFVSIKWRALNTHPATSVLIFDLHEVGIYALFQVGRGFCLEFCRRDDLEAPWDTPLGAAAIWRLILKYAPQ